QWGRSVGGLAVADPHLLTAGRGKRIARGPLVAFDQVATWPAGADGSVADGDSPALDGPDVPLRLQDADRPADRVPVRAVLGREVVQPRQPGPWLPLSSLDPITDLGRDVQVTRVYGHVDTLPKIIPRQSLTSA